MDKNLPGLGRFHMSQSNQAHMPQLLSLCSGACELHLLKPMHLEPVLCNKRSYCNEKPMQYCSQQLEKARAQKDPAQPKKKKRFYSLIFPFSKISYCWWREHTLCILILKRYNCKYLEISPRDFYKINELKC